MKSQNLDQGLDELIDSELMNELVHTYLMSAFGYEELEAKSLAKALENVNKEAMKVALAECVALNAVLVL